MADLKTKFSIGDTVYWATTTTEKKQHPCPDCNGTKKWKAISPAGGEYNFGCPRCGGGYRSNRDLSLDYTQFAPSTRRLTIGSVQVNTSDESPIRYMCRETGVRSGSVYYEEDMFATETEALVAATAKAAAANADTSWVVEQYKSTLSVSDYQLDSASLEAARNTRHSYSAKLENLFDDLRVCETIEQVREVLDGFSLRDAA